MKDEKNITPILRSFMHAALLRRLGMVRTAEEEQRLVEQFLSISSDEQAKRFIYDSRSEARADDLLQMRARKRQKGRRR